MVIKTQEELFSGPVKIREISEKGIRVSKLFHGDRIKAIFKGEVRRNKNTVEIKGKFFVEKSVECVRCLDNFLLDVQDEIEIFLRPAEDLPQEEEIELGLEDLNEDFYEGEEFDFYDYILRLAELFIPNFPLCSEECKGLCHECGENLNKSVCQCKEKRKNEREGEEEGKAHETKLSYLLSKAIGEILSDEKK